MLSSVVARLTRSIVLLRLFARRTDGVSAVEFGLLAPVLLLMLSGAIELSGAITASNRATYVTDAVAEMASRADHRLSTNELKNFALATALVDPDIIRHANITNKDVDKAFKITITSVQFEAENSDCLTFGCAFKAHVVFSYTMNGTKRACGELSPAAATSQTLATLPTQVFGPGSLVVIDAEIFYSPIMATRLADTIGFSRSAYFRPRYVPRLNSDDNCSGY